MFELLKNVKVTKAAEYDQISGNVFQNWEQILPKRISEICNLSMTVGSSTDACKVAKVKLLFKKGLKNDSSNYRLISLQTLLPKVFDRVVHDLRSYITLNQVLKKTHSTDTSFPYLYDNFFYKRF